MKRSPLKDLQIKLKRLPGYLKATIIMALVGIAINSFNTGGLALGEWFNEYREFLGFIVEYGGSGIAIFFGWGVLFAYLFSMWYHTLFTYFLIRYIIELIFDR